LSVADFIARWRKACSARRVEQGGVDAARRARQQRLEDPAVRLELVVARPDASALPAERPSPPVDDLGGERDQRTQHDLLVAGLTKRV
jgi:hypothetical protein